MRMQVKVYVLESSHTIREKNTHQILLDYRNLHAVKSFDELQEKNYVMLTKIINFE